jgi:putative membrane protein insertion efficiency factor
MLVGLSIAAIRLYQRIAPDKIRGACRFEPSCSNYAILALQKYGFFKGWKMAMNRLMRCKIPNGGEDYP